MGLPLHVQGDHGSPATIFDGIGLPDQDDKVCHGNAETATGLPRPTQVDAGTPKVSQTATGFQTQAPDDTVSRNSNRYDPNFNHQGNGSPKTNQSGPGSQAQGDVGSQNKRQNGTGIPHLVGSDFRSAKNKAASTPAAPILASSQPRQVPKLGGPDSMIRQCSGTGTQGQDLYLHLGVPTMSWIPKSARALAASLLSRLIEDVLHKNDWESWQKLMSFAPVCFQGGQKSDVKSPSLTTVTKKRVSEFESTWNVTIDRPKVGKGRKKPSPEKGLSKAVSKKIAEGDVKGAVRIASSDDKLAPATTETTKKLQQLHPDPKHPYSCSLAPNADTLRKVLVVDNVGVRRAIKSFRPGSAGGPSGLKPQHLKCLTTKNLGNPAERLVSSLTSLCNLILRGDVPAEVRPFFFGASLTALAKKNDGVRPIASGNTIRRLAAKSACHLISSEQSMQLRPLQMGVGTRNGTEAIVHAVRRFLFASEGKVIFKVDFSNAFNTVCRKAMMLQILEKTPYLYPLIWSSYSQATYLYYRGTTLLSKEGVQQGDPLGPLLFSRGIQPLISNCESELNVWYLDDGTIGGTPGTVLQDCLKIQKNARNIGLELNPSKCELSLLDFPPEESARVTTMFQQEFVGVRIVEPSSLDLLGAPLDHQQIPNALDTKIEQLKTLGHSLKNLDGHDALFLLRHCLSIPKLLYTLRCTPCFLAPASLKMYDVKIKTILEEILNVRIDDKAWAQANLPVKYGGLGVRKATDVAIPAYMASINQCRVLCKQIWEGASHESDRVEEMGLEVWAQNGLNRPKEPKCQREWDHTACEKQCQSLLDKSKDIQEDRARLLASTAEGSGDWLNAFPIPSLGLKLSSSDLRIAISLRLGLQICETHSCICGKRVDQSGAHGLSCGKSKGRIPRHAMVNDLIKRALVSAGIPSILEPVGLSTADGKRPDGLTLIPWEHGRCLAWDFTCPDTMAPSHLVNTSIRKSGAAKEAENHKLAKYYQITGTHIVVPVGIETLGSYGPSASSFITTLGRKIRAETGEKNAGAYLRQAIGIAIQRGNAVSVMGTLPCTKALEEIYYTF